MEPLSEAEIATLHGQIARSFPFDEFSVSRELVWRLLAERERLLRVVEAAQRVWDTVPAEFEGEAAAVHAAALNALRDALAALDAKET